MTAALSKRQQARNERQLQELLGVPGNGRCADCDTQNPGWASWSLGIFLCVRCASLHRKLGVHVSKVKSLTMDSWSPEQVDNMKKMGNVKSNAIYNPKNVRPDIPIDADEVDGAMERFIRQKYELRSLSTNRPAVKQNTGSTGSGSWNEEPPPLPPKPKKFFASFRSASSTTSRQKQERITPPLSPAYSGDMGPEVPKKDKPTQVFGMKITGVGNNFDQKLTHLRDMGFSDPKRNAEILKSSNGNLDKAVETLVRLGEGSKPAPPPRTLTPVSMGSSAGAGLTVEKTRQEEKKVSNNPWDVKPDQPPRSASLPVTHASPPPRSQSADPISNSWNPFLAQPQQSTPQQSLQNSFQTLAISHTGPAQQQPQQSFFQQPSVPQIPQQYQNNPFHPQQVQPNPWQTTQFPQQQSYAPNQPVQAQPDLAPQTSQSTGNPFMQPVRSFSASPSNPWSAPSAPMMPQQQSSPFAPQAQASPAPLSQQSTNPFGSPPPLQPWQQQQPFSSSPQPMMNQQNYFAQTVPSQPQAQQVQSQPTQFTQPFGQNPWSQQSQQQIPPQQTAIQTQPQTQQFAQQPFQSQAQPPRHDKNSILALYNTPNPLQRQPLQTLQEDPNTMPQPQQPMFAPQGPQRSVTMPIQSSIGGVGMSSFAPAAAVPTAPPITQPPGARHVSNESVDFVGMGAGASGRHSPDAFAGLSARYMR